MACERWYGRSADNWRSDKLAVVVEVVVVEVVEVVVEVEVMVEVELVVVAVAEAIITCACLHGGQYPVPVHKY